MFTKNKMVPTLGDPLITNERYGAIRIKMDSCGLFNGSLDPPIVQEREDKLPVFIFKMKKPPNEFLMLFINSSKLTELK